MEINNQCPHCGEGRLRVWSELDDEEREVVRRLPAAAEYDLGERKSRHRWCSRCWHEESTGVTHDA